MAQVEEQVGGTSRAPLMTVTHLYVPAIRDPACFLAWAVLGDRGITCA